MINVRQNNVGVPYVLYVIGKRMYCTYGYTLLISAIV